jgi:hypothetical protein
MTDSANAIWRSRAAEPFPLRHFATCAYRGPLGAVPPGVAWRGGSCTAPLRHSAPQMEVAQSEAHA